MQSPFETVPDAAAIPILFATRTTWAGIAKELPEPSRQFAAANDFTAKPGKCLTLPAPDGKIAQVVFGLEDETANRATCSAPAPCPACCHQAPTASPMRRMMCASQRWRSRWGPTASAATARTKRPRPAGAA
jgi:hypothetical protein